MMSMKASHAEAPSIRRVAGLPETISPPVPPSWPSSCRKIESIVIDHAPFSSFLPVEKKMLVNILKFPCSCMFLLFAKNSKLNPKVFEAIYVQTSPTQGNGPREVLLRLRSMLRIPATSHWIRSQQAETRREQKSWEKMGRAPIRVGKETRCPGAPWPHVKQWRWCPWKARKEAGTSSKPILLRSICEMASMGWNQVTMKDCDFLIINVRVLGLDHQNVWECGMFKSP